MPIHYLLKPCAGMPGSIQLALIPLKGNPEVLDEMFMDNFDEDPLDLLEGDGDGVNETFLLFDKDAENQQQPVKNRGCAVVLMILTSSLLSAGVSLYKVLT
jgi:hypothetical protein